VDGVEMLVEVGQGGSKRQAATWGVEHPEELVRWTSAVLETFGKLGATLGAGEVVQVDALGTHDRLSLIPKGDKGLCVGLRRSLAPEQAREVLRLVLSRWAS
jgi:hypothetical protein